jgi:hypothetical protein
VTFGTGKIWSQIVSKGQFFSLHSICSSHPKNQNNERLVQKNLYVYAHHSRICFYFIPIPSSRKKVMGSVEMPFSPGEISKKEGIGQENATLTGNIPFFIKKIDKFSFR